MYKTNKELKEAFRNGDIDPGHGEIEDHGEVLCIEFPTKEGNVIFEYILSDTGTERTADGEYVEFKVGGQ